MRSDDLGFAQSWLFARCRCERLRLTSITSEIGRYREKEDEHDHRHVTDKSEMLHHGRFDFGHRSVGWEAVHPDAKAED